MHSFAVASARSTITRLEDEVKHVDASEIELLRKLETLRFEREAHHKKISQLRNVCAPIASLSNELLSQIFKLAPFNAWERTEYALCVSQVSSHWRDNALATPFLWSSIRVNSYITDIRFIELMTTRSGSHPLDIEFNAHDSPLESDQLAVILPLVSRWRNLLVSVDSCGDVLYDVLTPCEDLCAPILESFEVIIPMQDYKDVDNPLLVFQGGAPKLTHVKLEGVPLTSCQPPLSSIVSLQLCDSPTLLEPDLFRHILTASSHLTNLRLEGVIVDGALVMLMSSPAPPRIQVPSLRFLRILSKSLYYLLISFESPALESLDTYCGSIGTLTDVLRDTKGGYPRLESLTFRQADCTEWGAIWILLLLPSVKSVRFYACRSPNTFLERLVGYEGEMSIKWPLLQTIGVWVVGLEELSVLCDIVSARISRGYPLSCLQILGGYRQLPAEKLSWLSERVRMEEFLLD